MITILFLVTILLNLCILSLTVMRNGFLISRRSFSSNTYLLISSSSCSLFSALLKKFMPLYSWWHVLLEALNVPSLILFCRLYPCPTICTTYVVSVINHTNTAASVGRWCDEPNKAFDPFAISFLSVLQSFHQQAKLLSLALYWTLSLIPQSEIFKVTFSFSDWRKWPSSEATDNGTEVIGYWKASSSVSNFYTIVLNAWQSSFNTSTAFCVFFFFLMPVWSLFFLIGE